ncbi:hypothetical protein KIPB_006333 [Kipferlia bialata]|uniref:SRP54-type proteins GTP-binding domain-containing protein n=1 Tax=Kipferlia bialata TaxID=797122 RepID=A0A9K3CS83_9EUKA|nr:hypothetical protein KIPB_002732 [Kipferlia bialata]GIQ84778.1 hypothetical protein KIPB_006333 [Kipferlia bialata]|eukprot:g2732.t1
MLVAACDTFRSGAVEQLQKHCDRLKCDLYQQGYGKDAALVARSAIVKASQNKQDVVLIDTAGRLQTNSPQLHALARLVATNQPDLVLFCGEALVGNDGIDQLQTFNRALIDFCPPKLQHHVVDGIILTKFDTVGAKTGAALSMIYSTGKPIVYVGVGQSYPDIVPLDVDFVVDTLVG